MPETVTFRKPDAISTSGFYNQSLRLSGLDALSVSVCANLSCHLLLLPNVRNRASSHLISGPVPEVKANLTHSRDEEQVCGRKDRSSHLTGSCSLQSQLNDNPGNCWKYNAGEMTTVETPWWLIVIAILWAIAAVLDWIGILSLP